MPVSTSAPPAPPITPPRVVLIMDAPTNGLVASHFIQKGYSVEIVKDLKYCTTALLKTAKFIILNPDPSGSPFYKKIKEALKKMVPDRLLEGESQELLGKILAKGLIDVQASQPAHPSDQKLKAEAIVAEETAVQKELEPAPPQVVNPSDLNALAETAVLHHTGLEHSVDTEAYHALSELLAKIEPMEPVLEVSAELRKALMPFLRVCGKLRKLQITRDVLTNAELPENAQEELKKQNSPLAKPLMPERLFAKANDTEERRKQAESEGHPYPARKLPPGQPYDDILKIGEQQDELLLLRAKCRRELAEFCANQFADDMLHKVLRSVGVAPSRFYGTLYLTLCMQSLQAQALQQYKKLSAQAAPLFEKAVTQKKGGFSLFKKSGDGDGAEEEDNTLTPEQKKMVDDTLIYGCAGIQLLNDLTDYEADLVDLYWELYQNTMQALMQGTIKNSTFLRHIRAFLRFGLVSNHKALISEVQRVAILGLCDEDKSGFTHQDGETNIIFPDETVRQILDRTIAPSFDEDLELSGQGTPPYKYDKLVRKLHASQFKIDIYSRELGKWQAKIDKQNSSVEASSKMMEEKPKGSAEYKTIQVAIRECKSEIARLQKVVEKIQTIIDTEKETISETNESLASLGFSPSSEELINKEVQNIRKFCKLLANRKEPFFPFVLRDTFTPEQSNLYDRKIISAAINDFEKWDSTAFSADLVNAQNPRKRVMIRYSPTILVIPCQGNMGFCIAASSTSETGRIVLPVMSQAQSPLAKMIVETMADFRYETSKLNAGMDWMTSDTVVAAYAKVRWDYRKKSKEFREKSGIYNDLPDKKNFKVHYRLYIDSMDEAGKKLFYKCYEMYDAFAKYIPVPDNMQRLKKA